jgi:hypothetical protein
MTKRGKVLRDTSAGPGLLSVDGTQHQFTFEGRWKSPEPPKPGMHVLVEFAPDSTILSVIPIPESQIAREQAEAVMKAAKEKGGVLVSAAVARFGGPLLIATCLILVSWLFLPTMTIQGLFGKESFTFWQVLGFVNAGNSVEALAQGRSGASAGFYGLLAFLALAGPFLHFSWKDKWASLAGILPIVFMLFIALMVRSTVHTAVGGIAEGPLAEVQRQAQDEMMNAISTAYGAYLAAAASLYLAAIALKNFLLARSAAIELPAASSKAAA